MQRPWGENDHVQRTSRLAGTQQGMRVSAQEEASSWKMMYSAEDFKHQDFR